MRVWGGVLVVSALVGGCTALNPSYQTQLEGESAGGSAGDVDVPSQPGTTTADDPPPVEGSTGGEDAESDTTGGEQDGSTGDEEDEASSSTGAWDEPTTGVDGAPPHLVFLNYEGVELAMGLDDAHGNASQINSGNHAPFQSPEMMDAIVAGLEEAWSGINVEFVLERPDGPNYTMLVITPTNSFGGALGIAYGDCENQNPNSVAFVFTNNGYTVDSIVGVASRELGFAYGLEVIEHPEDFMRNMAGVGSGFFEQCNPLLPASICNHGDTCGGGQQSSFFELQERLGAR